MYIYIYCVQLACAYVRACVYSIPFAYCKAGHPLLGTMTFTYSDISIIHSCQPIFD